MKSGYYIISYFSRLSILMVFMSVCVLTTNAQDISVTEFYLDEKDLTANGRYAVEDQNGDKCALIRVQTTQKGFSFDVGKIGITKVEDDHVGEIWLWVPFGIRHISIRHQQFGSLPNYYFPITIQKARTYIMKITHDQVFVTNYDYTKKQRLNIKIYPANASLSLNGMSVNLDSRGEATIEMAHGQFPYKVEAKGYYPKEGQIAVNDKEHSLIVNDLNPIKGKLSVHVNPYSAEVFVDGRSIGRSALEPVELQIGQHEVMVSSDGYRTETRTVTINENQTTDISVSLSQIANYRFTTTPSGANIYVNKEHKGSAPFSTVLTTGTYNIKATKAGYKDYIKSMKLSSSNPNVNIVLSKIYNYKSEFYIETNVRAGTFVAMGATIGGYIHNVNVEASYLYGVSKSETIYWSGNNTQPLASNYTPAMNVLGKIGYGVPISTRFRLTPQIGVNFMKLKETMESGVTVTPADGAYAASALVSLRFSAAFVDYFALNLSPEYSFNLTKSDGYTVLSEVSPKIKKWSEGFNVKLGITVFI
ncbi:MAG: PEGA domain-containing protein [Bacteroidaceae bacterium]|nr:PEGA domain-containing protein [Bacteroidaceae bacterium]